MSRFAALAVCFLYFPRAFACSFAPGFELFEPDLEKFERKFNESQLIALLPAPDNVELVSVVRGTVAPGSSCDDAGILRIKISWPENSVYGIDEIGFYFRTDTKKLPDYIFPLVPVVPTQFDGRDAVFTFVWLDGHPSQQQALDFELEVFAVNKGLQVGPGKTIRLSP